MKTVNLLCLFVLYMHCEAQCPLPRHPSVEYHCLIEGSNPEAFRACQEIEPAGTFVSPTCRSDYYSMPALRYMRCLTGRWDYIAKCIPECGTVTPEGTQLVLGGKKAKQAEVPWHAGIYSKMSKPYKQLCGGTLISNDIIISAAHCFWDGSKIPAERYAVAVGKLNRPWNDSSENAQYSDVKELHLADHFQGIISYYQSDIAVVIVTKPFQFNRFVRPVCVDFDDYFETIQLQPGKKGKVAGWGLTSKKGDISQVLQVIDLPFIPTGTCISESPSGYKSYITTDKFCAGYKNASKALCKGDSGGGLAFGDFVMGKERFYLRGVVSSAPTKDYEKCNPNDFISFTQLQIHKHFVKKFLVAEDALSLYTQTSYDDTRIALHKGACVLPPYPQHGTYVTNLPNAMPGDSFNSVVFNITCDGGYTVNGSSFFYCHTGHWSATFPKCINNVCNIYGITGICTIFDECPSGLEDFKNGRPPPICASSTEVMVCCVLPVFTTTSKTTTRAALTTTENTLSTTENMPGYQDFGEENSDGCFPIATSLTSKKTRQKAWDKCLDYQEKLVFPCMKSNALIGGMVRANRCYHHADELIEGGENAFLHEFPHMVYLGYGNENDTYHSFCSGTLISENFVLTAGHCAHNRVHNISVTYVVLGTVKRSNEASNGRRYKIKRIIKHPHYNPPEIYNDIALLELAESVPLDEFTVPACLHTGNVIDDSRAIATGWGEPLYGGSSSDFLQKVVLDKFESVECKYDEYNSRSMPAGFNPDSQICFGDSIGEHNIRKNTCQSGFRVGRSTTTALLKVTEDIRANMENSQGDSGGPLVVKNKDIACMYTIIGVTSIGKTCGVIDEPGLYTRVTYFIDWIEDTVWPDTPNSVPSIKEDHFIDRIEDNMSPNQFNSIPSTKKDLSLLISLLVLYHILFTLL